MAIPSAKPPISSFRFCCRLLMAHQFSWPSSSRTSMAGARENNNDGGMTGQTHHNQQSPTTAGQQSSSSNGGRKGTTPKEGGTNSSNGTPSSSNNSRAPSAINKKKIAAQANKGPAAGTDEDDDDPGAALVCCGLFPPISRVLGQLLFHAMGAVQSSSTSSPSDSYCSSPCHSPERQLTNVEANSQLILRLISRRPVRMNYGMQRAIQLLVRATPEQKLQMLDQNVLGRICALITEYSNLDLPAAELNGTNRSVTSLMDVMGGGEDSNNRRRSSSAMAEEEQQNMENGNDGMKFDGNQQQKKKFILGGGRDSRRNGYIGGGARRSSAQQQLQQQNGKQHKRAGSAEAAKNKGIGYGTGSTKSRWNIERAVEERAMHEEHLILLLSTLISFLWGNDLLERICEWEMALGHKGGDRRRSVPTVFIAEMPVHLKDERLAEHILQSAVIPLLAYHLGNDSVLDVSQHLELYQVLFEVATSLAGIPALLPQLVLPQGPNSKSIAKELIPQFRGNLNNYPTLVRGISEADIGFMDFIRKINDFSEVILRLARQFERQIPMDKRVKTSYAPRYIPRMGGHTQRRRKSMAPIGKVDSASSLNESLTREAGTGTPKGVGGLAQSASYSGMGIFNSSAIPTASARQRTARLLRVPRQMSRDEIAKISGQSVIQQYRELLREMQMSTWKLINDAGKPVHGFSFKKELRSVNPFSATHKDRTKRIAKELASMHNSLPLNASNAIFICMDETRCDMLKVLMSGPDDTPYQNGLFEFDVFFPVNYPQQPPKCSFLTTGAGNVRFNPNLYNDGKICLSILGTWEGRPEEKWNPFCSLLQVLISIQGLIFVKQPYFNEPGFEKHMGTPKGEEFSRKYNLHIENATLVYAIYEQWKSGPAYFRDIIHRHFWVKRQLVIQQAEHWLQQVAENIKNSQGNSKEESDGMIDGIFANPVVQRQNVRKLVEEFRDMENPLLTEAEQEE